MEKYLTHVDYELDTDRLLVLADNLRHKAQPYVDSRYDNSHDQWLMLKFEHEYLKKVMNDFEIEGSPRFYWQEPYYNIPTHIDNNTKCSLNFILTDEAAPVTFEDKHNFYYQQCLLNTSLPHSVHNGEHERLLLKISIFHESYESVTKRIKYKKQQHL